MKRKNNLSCMLTLLITLFFFSCNEAKKEESSKTDGVKVEAAPISGFDPAMDATKVAGYPGTVLVDSLNLKAYEFLANPGDAIPMHAHPDHVLYVLEGGTAEITGSDGKAQVVEFKKGACIISGPQSHSAKNTGTTAIKLLIVHVYRPRG